MTESDSQPATGEQRDALRQYISKISAGSVVDNGVAYDVLDTGQAPSDEVNDLRARLHALQQKMLQAQKPPSTAAPSQELALEQKKQEQKAALERFKKYGAVGGRTDAGPSGPPVEPTLHTLVPSPDIAKEPEREPPAMAARLASLEAELNQARRINTASRWSEPKTWIQMLAIAALIIFIVKLVMSPFALQVQPAETSQHIADTTAATTVDRSVKTESNNSQESVEQSIRNAGTGANSDAEFSSSVRRLMLELGAFPHDSFRDLVKQVNRSRTPSYPLPCPFEWNSSGELALILDLHKGAGGSVSDAMDRCSDALESLQRQKTQPHMAK